MELLDCEYHLTPGNGRLKAGSDQWAGPVDLGPAVLHSLQQMEINPLAYGTFLFDVLFPPGSKLREGYRLMNRARRKPHGWLSRLLSRINPHGLRFRLHLDEELGEEAQTIAWELLFDSEQDEALARSSWIAFSRYLSVNGAAAAKVPGLFCPRALIAIADAPDLKKYYRLARLNREGTQRAMKQIFRGLWGRISRGFLKGHVTLTALQQALQKKSFNILHLVAHGYRPEKSGEGLILQDEDGLVEPASDEALAEAFLGSRGLRLVVFLVCHSGAARRDAPFRGLPWRLLQRGVPAVVAMRREISLPAAELFASTFYPALAKCGEVDVAINTARRQLFFKEQDHWGDPVLFMKEVPWRRSRSLVLVAIVVAAILASCFAVWGILNIEPDPPPRRAAIQQPGGETSQQQEEKPAPEPPVFLEMKVNGELVMGDEELNVSSSSGSIQGKLQGPAERYTVRAVSSDESYEVRPITTEASRGKDWVLSGVPFRMPLNPGETHAEIKVEAGPPFIASTVIRVRAPAPKVEIEEICVRECDPFSVSGTAKNLLERELIWVGIRSMAVGELERCFYDEVSDERWEVGGRLGSERRNGRYQIRVGLAAERLGGQACPDMPSLLIGPKFL